MSAREWKAGDVALIEAGCWANRKVALRLAEGWAHTNGVNVDGDGIVAPVRPLVVIDAEDREQIERLHTLWCKAIVSKGTSARQIDSMQAALREFVNPTPPRIDEPGTWGVVEAACVHSPQRRKWIRHDDDNWWPAEKYSHADQRVQEGRDPRLPDDWDSLIDPVLVREGVQA